MRLNINEELQERRLGELQRQQNKTLGMWAKRQLGIEQEIATRQSPLQRARRIRNKRQGIEYTVALLVEELNTRHVRTDLVKD